MNLYSLTGIITVQAALVSYSIAIISEQRKRLVTRKVLTFLTLGVLLDITATAFNSEPYIFEEDQPFYFRPFNFCQRNQKVFMP